MGDPLKLRLKKVTCVSEQPFEPGKDEMYLLGLGITGGGQRFVIPPTSLGSYETGDVNKGQYPKTLVNAPVGDGEGFAEMCLFLFERDRGNLANSGQALAGTYNAAMNSYLNANQVLGLPPESQRLYSFAQSMVNIRSLLETLGNSNSNSDDIMEHQFRHMPAMLPQPHGVSNNGFELVFQKEGASYALQFDYDFRMAPVVVS